MQGDAARARDWLDAAQSAGDAADGAAWFPPFVLLAEAAREIARRGLPIALGAQNISAFVDGAMTGEISARMVKEAGCAFALVGHSERRTKCGETDADCAQKITRAREAGIAPILCVGETRDQRDSGANGCGFGIANRRRVGGRKRARGGGDFAFRLRAGVGYRRRRNPDGGANRRRGADDSGRGGARGWRIGGEKE